MGLTRGIGIVATLCLATAGTAQTGTGIVHYGGAQVLFTWTFESKTDGDRLPLYTCDNECEGKKHAKHDACDHSCDKKCPRERSTHYLFFFNAPETVVDLGEGEKAPSRSHILTMGDDYSKFGMPRAAAISAALRAFKNKARESLGKPEDDDLESKCWNQTPCSSSTAFVNSIKVVYRIDYELVAVENGQITERGPKRTLRWALHTVPPLAKDRRITTSEPAVSCACEVVQKEPSETGFLPGFLNEEEFAFIEENGTKRPVTGQQLASAVSDITVQNMNRVVFTVGPGQPTKFFVPAGWELECTSGNGQDVQLQEDLWITVMPWPQRVQAFLAPVTIRTLCLEIDEPEPTPAMKYRFKPPSTPAFARLARGVRGSSFRGPWDQARLWVATDYATYANMRQVLLPAPSRRTFLYEMYVAAKALAFSPTDPRADAVMEISLLTEPKNDLAAGAWLLTQHLGKNAKRTADWLRTNAATFHHLFSEPSAVPYVSYLAKTAAATETDDGVLAAIRLLTDCVPADKRADVAADGNSEQVAFTIMSTGGATAATAILDWLEKTKPSYTSSVCLNVSPTLPESVQARARALATSSGTKSQP